MTINIQIKWKIEQIENARDSSFKRGPENKKRKRIAVRERNIKMITIINSQRKIDEQIGVKWYTN